jgi:DNA polymerase/3'-5' exonuclease PolX
MRLTNELTNIQGIGPSKAQQLILNWVKSINQLKDKTLPFWNTLSLETQIHLTYNPSSVPRNIIDKMNKDIFKNWFPNKKYEILGSYSRNVEKSNDIDILVLCSINELNTIMNKINEQNKVNDHHEIKIYMSGNNRVSFLLRFPFIFKRWVKVDIFRSDKSDYIFQKLYLTGSYIFNIRMRKKANDVNYLLNQRGLFRNKIESKDNRVKISNELEIFKTINMEYVSPEKR